MFQDSYESIAVARAEGHAVEAIENGGAVRNPHVVARNVREGAWIALSNCSTKHACQGKSDEHSHVDTAGLAN